jgi:hypothetical protein
VHTSCLDDSSENPHMRASRSEDTWCTHKFLAAMHRAPGIYFQTELFVTANKERGPLPQIINSEN